MTWNMLVTQQLLHLLRHEVEGLGSSPLLAQPYQQRLGKAPLMARSR